MAKDLERDWARTNPQPQSTLSGECLTLWNFPVGGVALAPAHRDSLVGFVAVDLGLSPAASPTRFYVVGHASRSGGERGNLALSEQRAEGVAAFLASEGAAKDRIDVTWVGADQPLDSSGSGIGLARNRRVEVHRLRAEPTSRVPPPLEAGPARSDAVAPVRPGADGHAFTVKGTVDTPPFPIPLRVIAADVKLVGEVELTVRSGQGDTALVGALQGGRLSPEFETLVVDGIKGKVVVGAGEDGRPPGLQIGAQLERLAGKPEIGVQAGTKPVYVEFELKEMAPLDEFEVRGVRVAARFRGKVRFEFGPSATTAARLALSPAGAAAGVVAVAALINGGTAVLAQSARGEGLRAMEVLAERDGVASAVAYEVLGQDALVQVKNQELMWMKLEGDTRAAFRTGTQQVRALLERLGTDGRKERRKRWDTAYAAGLGAMQFPDVQRRILVALGGDDTRRAGTPLEDL